MTQEHNIDETLDMISRVTRHQAIGSESMNVSLTMTVPSDVAEGLQAMSRAVNDAVASPAVADIIKALSLMATSPAAIGMKKLLETLAERVGRVLVALQKKVNMVKDAVNPVIVRLRKELDALIGRIRSVFVWLRRKAETLAATVDTVVAMVRNFLLPAIRAAISFVVRMFFAGKPARKT